LNLFFVFRAVLKEVRINNIFLVILSCFFELYCRFFGFLDFMFNKTLKHVKWKISKSSKFEFSF